MTSNQYQRYKSIFALQSQDTIQKWIQQESSFDVIEFSVKFKKTSSGFAQNPERYSFWKYNFEPVKDKIFLENGFRHFEDFAKETEAENRFKDFQERSLEFTDAELRYFSFGIEIASEPGRTRLKTYAGYRSRTNPQLPFIIRNELSLAGFSKRSKYDGYAAADPRIHMIVGDGLQVNFPPCFQCVYAESGRLHFKSDPDASYMAFNYVSNLVDCNIGLASDSPPLDKGEERFQFMCHTTLVQCNRDLDSIKTLLDNGFQIEVITFRRSELLRSDIQNFTIYVRDKNWRSKLPI